LFIFSLVWSIGCTTNLEGRDKFDKKVRELMGPDHKFRFPAQGLVYDYCFDRVNKEWKIWTDTVPPYSVDNKLSYGEIVVPTFDSIRMKYLKKILIMNKKHVLSPGPTGTGKTVNINELLTQDLPEEYQSIPITFSAQTSANQT
jgi:dynein heavy chain